MSKTVKLALAWFLGLVGLFLMFFMGEEVSVPQAVPGAKYINEVIFMGLLAGYFLIAEYCLTRGNPQAVRKAWSTILALNLMLLVSATIGLAIEPNKSAVIEASATAMLTLASSCVVAALAARAARQRLL